MSVLNSITQHARHERQLRDTSEAAIHLLHGHLKSLPAEPKFLDFADVLEEAHYTNILVVRVDPEADYKGETAADVGGTFSSLSIKTTREAQIAGGVVSRKFCQEIARSIHRELSNNYSPGMHFQVNFFVAISDITRLSEGLTVDTSFKFRFHAHVVTTTYEKLFAIRE